MTECDSEPLVPVTPTWTVEALGKVHDSVATPEPVTLVGETVHAVLLLARLTMPANPFCAVTVIEEVPADPAFTVTLGGLAAIEKSWNTKVTLVWLVVVPLVAVTISTSV